MKILLLGCNGQVGWELQRSLSPLGELIVLSRQGNGGLCGDLSDPESLAATVKTVSPDIIVNAVAYTAVDQAESESEKARLINGEAPARLAREAKIVDAVLVHYSTDYVFDGTGRTPWREDDPTGPLNVYGQTKLEGEQAVQQSGCHHLIFRTSWVYAARGKNFISTMLDLAATSRQLKVIDDQVGAPTGAELIADATAHVLSLLGRDRGLVGTYHLATAGQTSWWGYARLVIESAARLGMQQKLGLEDILAVPSEEFPTPAARPRNSRLDTGRFKVTFGLHLPPWEEGVLRAVQEIVEHTRNANDRNGI